MHIFFIEKGAEDKSRKMLNEEKNVILKQVCALW